MRTDGKNKFSPKILINQPLPIRFPENLIKDNKLIKDNRSPLMDDHNSASLLSEYNLIILNFTTPVFISSNRQEQLFNYIESGKIMIFILNKFEGHLNGNSNYYPIMSSIFENRFIFRELEKGNDFSITQYGKSSDCNDYLNGTTRNYYISVNSVSSNEIISLADNVNKNSVSFILKRYPNCYFLPWIPGNEEEFGKLVLNLIYGSSRNGQPVDPWVEKYSFGNLIEVSNNITKVQDEIDQLENKKTDLILRKKNYERIRDTLLFRDGKILEEVTKEVLIELGIDAQLGKVAREDLVFIFNNKHYLVEVKGCEKSANKGHVKQVASHVVEYTEEEDIVPKGILIINAWRQLPLEERNTKDKPIFPNELMKLVNLSNIALMTTQQLFVAYCDSLEGKFDLEEFMKKIDSASGVMEGYNNIEKYKVKIEIEDDKS